MHKTQEIVNMTQKQFSMVIRKKICMAKMQTKLDIVYEKNNVKSIHDKCFNLVWQTG